MGTNYYLNTNVCSHCDRAEEEIHIGKSSGGWRFLFHVANVAYEWESHIPQSVSAWREAIADPDSIIKNEYGDVVDKDEFWKMVENKKDGKTGTSFVDPDGHRLTTGEFS